MIRILTIIILELILNYKFNSSIVECGGGFSKICDETPSPSNSPGTAQLNNTISILNLELKHVKTSNFIADVVDAKNYINSNTDNFIPESGNQDIKDINYYLENKCKDYINGENVELNENFDDRNNEEDKNQK